VNLGGGHILVSTGKMDSCSISSTWYIVRLHFL
jgi:hypothetical protein